MAIAEQEREMIAVLNPISGETIGEVPVTPPDEVAQAVQQARLAQVAWGKLHPQERVRFIRRWADLVWENQAEIIQTIRRETGKPDGTAFSEIYVADAVTQYYIHHAPRLLKPKRRPGVLPGVHWPRVYYKPHGVVGSITPWNYPFFLTFADTIPALLAGNAVVYKPSEITPYTAEIGIALMHEAGIPHDLVPIVHGDGRTGAALVDHVDYVAFTGSTATGRKIARRAGERLIAYSLELGGKDPMIVLNDADAEFAAAEMVRGAFENAGQYCMSVERVYVEAGIYDRLLEQVQHYAQKLTVSADAGAVMGSMTNSNEYERTQAQIQDALAKGASILHGGQPRPDLGALFHEPTVLVDVDHTMDVMIDETFGPILPIMKVQDADEALRLANESVYGLAGSVYTGDVQRGVRMAQQLETGDAHVNAVQTVVGTPAVPSGGVKQSGIGRRNGPEGLMRFVTPQTVVVNNGFLQEPRLVLIDDTTRKFIHLLRKVRRYIPFF